MLYLWFIVGSFLASQDSMFMVLVHWLICFLILAFGDPYVQSKIDNVDKSEFVSGFGWLLGFLLWSGFMIALLSRITP